MATADEEPPNENTGPSPHLSREERIGRWLEMWLAAMLGVVALATAWRGYEPARWGCVPRRRA